MTCMMVAVSMEYVFGSGYILSNNAESLKIFIFTSNLLKARMTTFMRSEAIWKTEKRDKKGNKRLLWSDFHLK